MNFEQNLQKIFTINKPATPVDRKHIFTSTDGMIRKTELIVEGEQTIEEEVEFHWNLPPQLSDYGWDGHP